MHNFHKSFEAFIVCLTLLIPTTFVLASAPISESVATKEKVAEAKNKPAVSQEAEKEKVKAAAKKHSHKSKKAKKAEETKAPEVKPEAKPKEVKPAPPPAPVTPDKKKYASPGGNQIMTDGTVINFESIGVIYMHGYRYSYYSSKVLYHYRTPEWYACDDHLYRTADGYIVVASKDHPLGSIVPTPFGQGKVMDACYVSGTIDIYVNF